jgi:crotonobetainyl-CoA:carnitine CoA-transferase CaiB-like acyl-CoA transferase
MLPLKGIQVLDLSRVLAGPYCGQLLADMGAEVLKVESPEGDENRGWGDRTDDGLTCNFSSVNRGKRSIVVNFKSPNAKAALTRLVERSDVVIQSFLPESAERLGITFDELKKIRPDIILCSISSYGSQGDFRNKPGYDLMMQAFSGVMSATGPADGDPVRCGVSFIDMSTGAIAYGGVVTALLDRPRSGACHVEVSLLRTAISMLGYQAVNWLQVGRLPERQGSGVSHLVPYQAFQCADGFLLTGATNDATWRRFCKALGRPDLAEDARFLTNDLRLEHRTTLIPILKSIFASRTVTDWVSRFEANRVAISPLQTLDQVLTHPQVLANGIIVEQRGAQDEPKRLIGPPFTLSGNGYVANRTPPSHGAHTIEVLRDELGLSDAAIAELTAGRGA